MKLKNFKGLQGGKNKEKDAESGVVIEGTTAEQLVEIKNKLNGRKKDMEDATRRIKGLSPFPQIDEDDEAPVGPHGPILELTLEDIPDDDEDPLGPLDEIMETKDAPQLKELTLTESQSPEEDTGLKSMMDVPVEEDEETGEDEETKDDQSDLTDSFSNLFGEEEDDDDPLANLIKNLPEVSAQELIDDIEEIKGIIREWQHSK